MSAKQILDDDWSDYDTRKTLEGSDHFKFSCAEMWEFEYLIQKIRTHHPEYSEIEIKKAVLVCCALAMGPHPREQFVRCVCVNL